MAGNGKGESKGQLDSKFVARINQLEDAAKQMTLSFSTMDGARPWHTPDELKTKELLDVPGLHEPSWNRNEINRIYSSEVLAGPGKKGGTTGDLIAMKWQADFMATEERAFRTRHASFARCISFMHGRLDGHSKAKVSVFSFLKDGVNTYIKSGRAK